jgi:hypothetical protein
MKSFVFLFSLAVVLVFAASQLNAAPLFKADFENTSGSNDPAAWNANNVTAGKNVFVVEGGRLKQTSDGCSETTKTPFPVDGANWTDYIVAADVWWYDDDFVSLLFRYTGPDTYYNFTVAASSSDSWYLGNATAAEGECFGDTGLPSLTEGPTGVTIDEAGGTAYTMAVMVAGSTIELFFGEQVDVEAGQMPPKMGEVTDSTYTHGTAGVHCASNATDFDNIVVLGLDATAVKPQDKLAATWGQLKSR